MSFVVPYLKPKGVKLKKEDRSLPLLISYF
ncbi:hypothetical protein VCRA2119O381_8840001 [Vibrio crassostreae]|nr:hypothetical protein VCRA2119O381_8840001 [Vibrio crassostreae]